MKLGLQNLFRTVFASQFIAAKVKESPDFIFSDCFSLTDLLCSDEPRQECAAPACKMKPILTGLWFYKPIFFPKMAKTVNLAATQQVAVKNGGSGQKGILKLRR